MRNTAKSQVEAVASYIDQSELFLAFQLRRDLRARKQNSCSCTVVNIADAKLSLAIRRYRWALAQVPFDPEERADIRHDLDLLLEWQSEGNPLQPKALNCGDGVYSQLCLG